MKQLLCPVSAVEAVASNVFVLSLRSPELAASTLPGQFVNIRVHDTYQPLTRRPFSVYKIVADEIKIIFNVIGLGTKILSAKRAGDIVDIIGPLGCSFNVHDRYETALLVGGGLGVAPLPMITDSIKGEKQLETFLGARTRGQIIDTYLEHAQIATDDGSSGYHGTVVDALRCTLEKKSYTKPKIFGCGPNVMLHALAKLAYDFNIPCEVSLESAMACGIGICQGCPVERTNGTKKYSLICKEGPVFDAQTIHIS